MFVPPGVESTLAELGDLAAKGDAEYLIPTRATQIGYEALFHEYLRAYGSWLINPEREAEELQPDFPFVWLKNEPDGEPMYGECGLGILMRSFLRGPPTTQELSRWMAGEDPDSGIRRSYCCISVADLTTQFPVFVKEFRVLFSRSQKETENADVAAGMGDLLNLLGEPHESVWLFCCSRENEPSVGSAEGLAVMAAHLQAKVKAAGTVRRFVVAIGNRAYRVLLDGAGYSVFESKDLVGLKRPMPNGMVWLRTGVGTEWNTIDSKGFGVCLDPRRDAVSDFMIQFTSTTSTERAVTDLDVDPLGAIQAIMAGLSGFPSSKAAAGFPRNLNGALFTLCRELSAKRKVTFWWLS